MWKFSQMEAFLFDLDGVLVESNLDLSAVKRELFGKELPILESIEFLPAEKRLWAINRLKKLELEASKSARLRDGAKEIVSYIDGKFKWGVVTRNCWDVVDYIRKRFSLNWDVAISRELAEPKPSPLPVISACKILRVRPENAVMIGDFEYDILSGVRAGARTVFLKSEKYECSCNADLVLNNLHELLKLVKEDPLLRQREFLKVLSAEEEESFYNLSVAVVSMDENTLAFVERLVRMGIGKLTIIGEDSKICASDADSYKENVGMLRKEFLKKRLLGINPFLGLSFSNGLEGDYDYIVDTKEERYGEI